MVLGFVCTGFGVCLYFYASMPCVCDGFGYGLARAATGDRLVNTRRLPISISNANTRAICHICSRTPMHKLVFFFKLTPREGNIVPSHASTNRNQGCFVFTFTPGIYRLPPIFSSTHADYWRLFFFFFNWLIEEATPT